MSRSVLKDQYNNDHEPDEVNPDPSGDSTADIYDDDTIPPAPKLQGNHSQSTEMPTAAKQPGQPNGQTADGGGSDDGSDAGAAVRPHNTATAGGAGGGATIGIGFWTAGRRFENSIRNSDFPFI